jgi:hypothetical protein
MKKQLKRMLMRCKSVELDCINLVDRENAVNLVPRR